MWSTIAVLFSVVSVVAPPGATVSCVPDAINSTVVWHDTSGPCRIPLLCPACDGTAAVDVMVHDQFNVPMAGIGAGEIWVETDAALGGGTPCAQVTQVHPTVPTDGSGRTTIQVDGAGGASRELRVMIDYNHKGRIVLGALAYRSCDGTGDLAVDLADLGLLAQSFNHTTIVPAMDLNCDAAVNLEDLGYFADHFSHGCR